MVVFQKVLNLFFFPLLVANIDLAQSHSTPLTPNLGTYWFKGMVLVQLFGGNIYFLSLFNLHQLYRGVWNPLEMKVIHVFYTVLIYLNFVYILKDQPSGFKSLVMILFCLFYFILCFWLLRFETNI